MNSSIKQQTQQVFYSEDNGIDQLQVTWVPTIESPDWPGSQSNTPLAVKQPQTDTQAIRADVVMTEANDMVHPVHYDDVATSPSTTDYGGAPTFAAVAGGVVTTTMYDADGMPVQPALPNAPGYNVDPNNVQLPSQIPLSNRGGGSMTDSMCTGFVWVNDGDAIKGDDYNNRRNTVHNDKRMCMWCSTSETPQWRKGPHGPWTLCNVRVW